MLRSGLRLACEQTPDAQLLASQALAAQNGPLIATTGANVCKHAIMAVHTEATTRSMKGPSHACRGVADGCGSDAQASPAVADDAGADAAESERSVPILPKLTGTCGADHVAQVEGCQQLPASDTVCTSGTETARRCISRQLRSDREGPASRGTILPADRGTTDHTNDTKGIGRCAESGRRAPCAARPAGRPNICGKRVS
jgi:hypothetical protein